jgi:hypothetical protein
LAVGNPASQPLIHHVGTGTSNKVFDLQYEKERRTYQEALWTRSKEDELKETKLRAELKEIEAQLRKLKRKGAIAATNSATGATAATGAASATASTTSVSASRTETPLPDPNTFGPPTPVPGVPYLQSARLGFPPVGAGGINKTLSHRLEVLLEEMKIPNPPNVPTKRVCDLYDKVRKDALELLVYQKNVLQKEGLLQNRRAKLEKLTGGTGTEEAVLGIPPRKTASSSGTGKKKAGGAAGGSGNATQGSKKKRKGGDNAEDSEKKTAGKRKRKTDSKSPTAAASASGTKGAGTKSTSTKASKGSTGGTKAAAVSTSSAGASGSQSQVQQQGKKTPTEGKTPKKRPRKS